MLELKRLVVTECWPSGAVSVTDVQLQLGAAGDDDLAFVTSESPLPLKGTVGAVLASVHPEAVIIAQRASWRLRCRSPTEVAARTSRRVDVSPDLS